MSLNLPYPGFPLFQVSFCTPGAYSRCAALWRLRANSRGDQRQIWKQSGQSHKQGVQTGSKNSTTHLPLSSEPGYPACSCGRKAAVHLGKMFLAKNKLAEADIHFKFMVIMERNITVFRQNSKFNHSDSVFVCLTKKQPLLIPQFGWNMGTISFIKPLDVEQPALQKRET